MIQAVAPCRSVIFPSKTYTLERVLKSIEKSFLQSSTNIQAYKQKKPSIAQQQKALYFRLPVLATLPSGSERQPADQRVTRKLKSFQLSRGLTLFFSQPGECRINDYFTGHGRSQSVFSTSSGDLWHTIFICIHRRRTSNHIFSGICQPFG